MMKILKYLFLVLFVGLTTQTVLAQGGYEDLLFEEVEVEDPVYMPVIGIGAGVINYYGELQNDFSNLIQGAPTYRINLYQYIDKKHYWKANLNVMLGKISGYERSYTDTSKNLNFFSETFGFGINFEYGFGNIYKGQKRIRPFFSLGGEYLNFRSKTDILDKNGDKYIYYPDGTIRVGDRLVSRDYSFETDINSLNRFGRDKNDASTYALVADVGADVKISDRVALRIATSLHYTFTDAIDDVSYENTVSRIGDKTNDMFSLTYVSLNIDLFSDPTTKIIEKLFADVTGDFDYTMIADSDKDGVLDLGDDCPDTPIGVAVNDSTGCPHDDDKDGVPNYMDKEQFSNKGAIVDEFGVELSANKIREGLLTDLNAVDRDDMYMIPVSLTWTKFTDTTPGVIPDKFKKLDVDGDSYISFDELLDAISKFFDDDSDYTTEDLYDLNSFFFAQ